MDDFDPYYSSFWKKDHLERLLKVRRFRLVRADLLKADLSKIFEPGCRVFHLAAQPGVRGSWGMRFGRYVRNNVLVTQRLLEYLSDRSPDRFIYGSSSSVYGNPSQPPTSELTLPEPVSPYGVTKLCAEHLVEVYRRARALPAVSLRFFTVYGPGQRPDMGFHLFLDAVRAGRPLTVYGRGDQLRDFTYVDDIVEGILAAGNRETRSSIFNLGGGSPTRLSDAIRLIGQVTGLPVQVRHAPPAEGDPQVTWADTGRARRELGFRPRVALKEGLARQWAWQSAVVRSGIRRANVAPGRA